MDRGVLLRVAAGPRIGFGHLVRAVSLSRVLGVAPVVALRGGRTARAAARRLGCSLVDAAPRQALCRSAPSVLVVDDPCSYEAAPWVRAARHLAIPVAAIHDQGIGAEDADLFIDGAPRVDPPDDGRRLLGPRFMVLDPVFSQTRLWQPRHTASGRVAVVLGGGVHAGYGREVAALLEETLGPRRVRVAPGFATGRPGRANQRARLAHARFLADAAVVLVGGGIGLYEVCCLGVPAVAVAVTRAQRPTVRTFAELGAVVDGGFLMPSRQGTAHRKARRLATCILRVLGDRRAQARLAGRARRVVDGRGGARVAAALRRLAATPTTGPSGGAPS